jgi:hypothetical protein
MLKIFSIRDAKTEVFNTPWFQRTHGEAERNFRKLVSDPKSNVHAYPEDYDLYYLGEYSETEGKFKTLDTPQHVCKAIQYAKEEGPSLTNLQNGESSQEPMVPESPVM